ncbi:hypothetical protein [Dipodfec virus UA06Rod_17]|uniref:Uncharacterized protein n=1 Tax=Dipodfec virus UA06Rod_17 TaxID=2929318 RepID=A0A976N1Z3_9VIRU|nr:hypothetical protein [Dipodfec virus UA06Rod_17]
MTNVVCYRYVWRIVGSDNLYFKIITGTQEDFSTFEESILHSPDVEIVSLAREYLHEYDLTKMSVLESIYSSQAKDQIENENK